MAQPSSATAGSPTPARAARDVLRIAAGMGLLSGGLYALAIWLIRVGFGRLTFHSRDVLWMAPLATAVLFLALAGLGVTPVLLLRRRFPVWLAAWGFGWLAVVNLLIPIGGLGRWAILLLGFGVGVQLARQVRVAPARWTRRLLTAGIGLTALLVGVALVERTVLAVRRAAAIRGLPQADASLPNVLLLVFDTVRGESLSLYGYPRPTTPALERWAAQGVVFEHAMTTSPWTLPSHGSLFTGELGSRLGGDWLVPVRPPSPTLAERLRQRGYRTAGFVANLLYTTYESGLTRGFTDYADYPVSLTQALLHCPLLRTGLVQGLLGAEAPWQVRQALTTFDLSIDHAPADQYRPAREITERFLRWQAADSTRPFFAFLNYFDAHAPYRAPPEIQARFAAGSRQRDDYDAAIAYLDAELDRLLRTLAERRALERTIVVVTSDHGELFGEHRLTGHANALYLPLLRVPLVVWYPRAVPAGVRVDEPVSLRDVPATILELAGSPGAVPGRSLRGSWDPASRAGPRSPIVSEVSRGRYRNDPNFLNAETWLQSVLDGEYHYIRSGLGREELYAWRTDSLERRNLADSPDAAGPLARLRAALDQAIPR